MARRPRSTTVARERARVLPGLTRQHARATAGYFRGMMARITPGLRAALAKHVSAKADGLATIDLSTINWNAETRILSTAVRPVTIAVQQEAAIAVGRELGISGSLDLPRAVTSAGLAGRIQQVTETSRDRIGKLAADGVNKGLSIEQIVRGVPEGTTNITGPVPAFQGIAGLVDSWSSTGTPGFRGATGDVPLSSSRAYLIALTETGNAYNGAAIETYAQSGLVDFVEVFDGPECGWEDHDDPDLAHGSIRTLEEAADFPLSHPNCQRAFGARLDATSTSPSPFTGEGAVPGATPGVGAVDPLDAEAVAHSGAGGAIPSSDVAEASQRAIEDARAAEPSLSATLLDLVDNLVVTFGDAMTGIDAAPGGDLAGFAARSKTLTSLSRKIGTEIELAALGRPPVILSADEAAGLMGDTVRYTVRYGEADYWPGVRSAAEKLLADGNVPTKWKPTFGEGEVYRGLNTNWRAANGTTFEVQFHPPPSFVVKELNHPLYEEARLLTTAKERKDELNAIMAARVAEVPLPLGDAVTFDDVLLLGR